MNKENAQNRNKWLSILHRTAATHVFSCILKKKNKLPLCLLNHKAVIAIITDLKASTYL